MTREVYFEFLPDYKLNESFLFLYEDALAFFSEDGASLLSSSMMAGFFSSGSVKVSMSSLCSSSKTKEKMRFPNSSASISTADMFSISLIRNRRAGSV